MYEYRHIHVYICLSMKAPPFYYSVEVSLVAFFYFSQNEITRCFPRSTYQQTLKWQASWNSLCWPARELGHQERQMNLLCQCQYALGFGEEQLAVAK